MNEMEYGYVVVFSTSHAIKIEKLLAGMGIRCKLVPVPRHISSDCGVCVRISQDNQPAVQKAIAEQKIEIQGFFQ